jgi:para-aminobenzoate synthetase / 4-amino-4-deoxychorismate lyase
MAPDRAQGVFETMRVADGRIHALSAHLSRLAGSLRQLYALEPPSELESELLARAAPLRGEHRLRVDLAPAGEGACAAVSPADRVHVSITTSPLPGGPPRPVTLTAVVVAGGLGAHKWRDRSFLDALGPDPVPLLIDADDTVLEAAWANVWLIDGDRLITPPADGRILPGVSRALLLEAAPSLGLQAAEQPIRLADARAAHAAFLTSSLRLAVPAAFEHPPADPDPVIARIRAALAGF